jgi:hypothetical protein
MSMHYSESSRAELPYAVPDIEVFHVAPTIATKDHDGMITSGPGWYWWSCTPGCLPDNEPYGPFMTEKLALDDAQY